MEQSVSADDLCRQSVELMLRGRYDLALDRARQAIELSPEWSEGYQALGRVLVRSGRFQESFEPLETAIALEPDDPNSYLFISIAKRGSGKTADAIEFARESVRLAPDSAQTHLELGRCRMQLFRSQEAEASFLKARELEPDNASVYEGLGNLYLKTKDYEQAENQYRKALELDPADADVLNNLGVALLRRGHRQEAAMAFKSAVILDPTLEVAKSNTKVAVGRYLGGGTVGVFLTLWLIGKLFAALGGEPRNDALALIGGVVVLIVVAIGIAGFVKRRIRRAKLETIDPQLMQIYRTICDEERVRSKQPNWWDWGWIFVSVVTSFVLIGCLTWLAPDWVGVWLAGGALLIAGCCVWIFLRIGRRKRLV